MQKILLLITFLFCVFLTNAQEPASRKVSVIINSDQNKPLEGVTVALLRSRDSGLVKTSLTDANGLAEFNNIKQGTYFIRASYSGFATINGDVFNISAEQLTYSYPALQMKTKSTTELQAVNITGRKPFIQKLSDRIVVNVDNSIVNAGSTAMEVLERSPGITINQNDNISLRGKAGVIIMIDGKPSPMSGADLANYLRGLPSNAIERIDIITNPSAKYDAAGNSGIIDIRMKKDQRMGTNGTLTLGYGQGVYPKANGGTTFNYRNKKVNIFGNYNYAYREQLNHLLLDRNFYNNGVFAGSDQKDNYAHMPVSSHAARLGADFFPGKNTIIGFVVNSNFSRFRRDNNNSSVINDDQHVPVSTFNTYATNNDPSNNTVANINLKTTFKNKQEFTADADYGVFNSASASNTATKYYNIDGTPKQSDYILNGNQKGKLTLISGKADFTAPLKQEAKIEAGIKTSYVTADNDAKFFDLSNGSPVNDVNKTNHFRYNETNTAGYINFNKNFKKFDFTLGLRGEQTLVNTNQLNGNIKWDSGYFQLFPSAFFNYKLTEDQTLGFSVSRRIDRPGYSQLNPFLFLIDVTTYATGNTALLPQLTWGYEISYTHKNINFSVEYSHTKDPINILIARFSDIFPNIPVANNVTVQVPVNLNSSDYFGLSISAPVKIKSWWNMINNVSAYYNHFNGSVGGSALNNGSPAADFRINNSFTFKKGWAAELNGTYSTPGRYGYMKSRSQWGLAAGVQKKVFKNKGTLRFNVTDIFWTNLPRATITYEGSYVENWHAYRESRVANLGFTYNFGNNKVQSARKRTTASEEERRRVGQ